VDDDGRHLLFAGGVACLCALAAAPWFCVGLAGVLQVGACDTLLGFSARVTYTVGGLLRRTPP
jgi:hypothetical protein